MFATIIKLRSKPAATPLQKPTHRIDAIDFLRGLVMVIMALDHTRDFLHVGAWTGDPLDLSTTTPALFFTRWITHFCAPVFVFLAGTSGFLQGLRKSKKELSLFLVKRGLWLVLTEVTLVTFGITFDVQFSMIVLQTIWAIGISMVCLGLAVWLPFKAILILGLLIVLGHNSLDYYEAKQDGFGLVYSLVHRQNFLPIGKNHLLAIMYPFLPWTGLMLLGYCFGSLFTSYEGSARRKVLTRLGGGIILFFILLRITNSYGDPLHWAAQKTSLFTLFSFINTTKYPPSLLYMCMTIGPAILAIAWMGTIKNRFTALVTVFGRVPFFYYILHFYLLHTIALVFSLFRGHSFAEGAAGIPEVPLKFVFPGEGVSLAVTYVVWMGVVVALYPLCQWFCRYKQTHKQWWLSYL